MNLSTKQRQVVESSEKYMCVIAGAGSGKTRTLTERIRRLISASKRGERVLAITFSNKAANELKERLLQSYSQAELNELVYVGTIHNFCMDIISQRAHLIGLPNELHIFESFVDRFEVFKAALINIPQLKSNYLDDGGKIDTKKARELFEELSMAKKNLKFPKDYQAQPLKQRLYQDYNDLMLAQNAIDFDDILLHAYRIMVEKPAVARIYHRVYRHICVDEAQDLNRAQYSVVKAIAGEAANLLMVGDPNQSIYGFNGSSSKYMCEWFVEDFKAKEYRLDENYRSSQKVIEAARAIEPTFEVKGILPIAGEVEVQCFQNEEEEASWVVGKIRMLLNQGHKDIEGEKCTLEQCIVLARNRYVFNSLEALLKSHGVNYNLRTSTSQGILSESNFFKIFDLGLRLLVNPRNTLHLEEMKGLLSSQFVDCRNFDDLRTSQQFSDAIAGQGADVLNRAWDILQPSQQELRFDKALEILLAYCTPKGSSLDNNELSLMHNDCSAWEDRWNRYVQNSTLDNRSLAHMMRAIALGITNTVNESGVTLSTVHMSKGLEFDVVFIMGLSEGVFPDYRALNDDVQLAEEQQNMFVSITRSKRLCYLSYPEERIMPWGGVKSQDPSRYIRIIDEMVSS